MEIELHDRENSDEAKAIQRGLVAYNEQFGRKDSRQLVAVVRDEQGEVAAGLSGYTAWGWLFVQFLWVREDHRKGGFGSKLMDAAEDEARRRGCHSAWLDTFAFQARGFYEKRGYSVFGELKEYPRGYARFFLEKKL